MPRLCSNLQARQCLGEALQVGPWHHEQGQDEVAESGEQGATEKPVLRERHQERHQIKTGLLHQDQPTKTTGGQEDPSTAHQGEAPHRLRAVVLGCLRREGCRSL